jgi:hypothetical protein
VIGVGRRLPGLACATLVGAATLVALVVYPDYGVTWDEGVQALYGEQVLAYFRSGLADTSASRVLDLRFYGPLFDALAALASEGAPERRFEIRHLCIALVGLLTLPALMLYARSFGLRWLPALCGLGLATHPRFWGHLFNNSKDIPFAAAFAASFAALAALLRAPGLPWTRVLVIGLAFGVAAAIRPGGLPLLAVALAGVLGLALWRDRAPGADSAWAAAAGALKGASALALAWGVMVLPWPWAHEAPLAHPLEAMRRAAAFDAVYTVLFEGQRVPSDHLPAWYLPEFLAIATPPLLLLLALGGVAWGVREQLRAPRSDRALLVGLTQLWFFAPLLFFVLARPNAYDGMRHFLFVLPALAAFAALGARALVCAAPPGRVRLAAGAALVLALALPVADLVRLHPYQSSYFNLLVGGLAGAEGRYETDYWKSSYKEAMEWLNARSAERPERPLRVLVAANALSVWCAEAYAGEGIELARTFESGLRGALPEPFDYYVATYRYGKRENFPDSPIVHTIGRDGAVFTVIRGRR